MKQPLGEARERVAVVFFHGMGQQRRYESLTMMAEVFREYARAAKKPWADRPSVSRREQLEAPGPATEIGYELLEGDSADVRVYEAYWAPQALRGTTAFSVFLWMLGLVSRPFMLLRGPWRSYARLRRADLITLAKRRGLRELERAHPGIVAAVAREYEEFVVQPDNDPSSFEDFVAFMACRSADGNLGQSDTLVSAAKLWRIGSRRSQLARLLGFAALAVTLLSAVAFVVIFGVRVLPDLLRAVHLLPPTTVSLLGGDRPYRKWYVLVGMALAIVGFFGATSFLANSMGDVQQFCTYEENDVLHARREGILATAEQTMRHVLGKGDIDRVVVVGHSLGTMVALDTVLRLRGKNEAAHPDGDEGATMLGPAPLGKIQHFITSGSPIDKINYLFGSKPLHQFDYENLLDSFRGDISSPPFCHPADQPYVHWINFWDQGDVVSGHIETVASPVLEGQRVDNVRIASFRLPDLVTSHGKYFDNSVYQRTVYETTFENAHSFAGVRFDPKTAWLEAQSTKRGSQTVLLAMLALATACSMVFAAYTAAVALPLLHTSVPLLGGVAVLFGIPMALHGFGNGRAHRHAR